MKTTIVTVPGVRLSDTTPMRREPSRPVDDRGPDFASKFDDSTLFYDAIFTPEDGEIRVIAPPLLNLQTCLQKSVLSSSARSDPHPVDIKSFDRQSQLLVKASRNPESLRMAGPLGEFEIPVHTQEGELFEGQRVLFSISRNNKLEWIKDWVQYYRDMHGATAVLLYDNNSDYDARDLAGAIAAVGGLQLAVIVRWPFKHGPAGSGHRRLWDSNFSQLAMMEHARWRYLSKAASVLNCDVDELVLSRRGNSIFEAVEASNSGVIAFYGDWVFGLSGQTREPTAAAPMRFRDYQYVLRNSTSFRYGVLPTKPMRCKSKWALVPNRVPKHARWHIHYVEGWLASRVKSMEFRFRHYREISTSWKYDRTDRVAFDPRRHEVDGLILENFARIGWIPKAESVRSGPPGFDLQDQPPTQ